MNDPHEQGKRLPGLAKSASDESFLSALNYYLEPFSHLRDVEERADLPIVYIVGAPRSGTTLLSQVLSRFLPVGYVNNFIARFWMAPSVGVRLSQIMLGDDARRSIDFRSHHGVTGDLAGPHEYGYFWRHWLSLDTAQTHHLTAIELEEVDVEGLRKALRVDLLGAFGTPMVFKNVICGFQASLLRQVHPNSIFLHISRSVRDTAASILKSRFERYGSYDIWWSLKPSTFDRLPKDPVRQVVAQILDCRREVDEELDASAALSIRVDYEQFCRDPNNLLLDVCGAIEELGVAIVPLGIAEPFTPAGCPKLPEDIKARLEAAVSDLNES
ncbi:MAG: sulfotransferase [Candidatus Accumulibacter sp.]|uniref:Sulfotransferase n=1 Tax=Candidatus Accumulibacter proximus TaxID=2954385 RepID=A0A935PX61_9PROT|nr:sulfotransferase [Candidatus Accumulibacter proximus]